MVSDILKLIKDTIYFSTDSENMEEAIKWFEERRHKPSKYKTQEFFDELVISQVAIIFKILIDAKEVEIENNVIKLNQKDANLKNSEAKRKR